MFGFVITMFCMLGSALDHVYGSVYRRDFGDVGYTKTWWWKLPFGVFILYQIEKIKKSSEEV
jgi:hypothetical protein